MQLYASSGIALVEGKRAVQRIISDFVISKIAHTNQEDEELSKY